MKTTQQQRDELFTLAARVLNDRAETAPSYTAQSFISRANALHRCGNDERAIEYLNIAASYVYPEKVTV